MPSFAIILTTHKRPGLVIRSIQSVLAQTYSGWRLIIVNDSPDTDYTEAEVLIRGHEQVSYVRNDTNLGKNASVNRAIDFLRAEGFEGHVVFLDDDDWLAPTCLADFAKVIEKNDGALWLVSDRSRSGGVSFTKNRTGRSIIKYYPDCLILKRFSGDATHCIRFTEASKCHFLNTVKNAEEWFFFSQLAQYSPTFTYLPLPGTYSEGYTEGGLTRTSLSHKEKLGLYLRICKELSRAKVWNAYTTLYMLLRFGRIFL